MGDLSYTAEVVSSNKIYNKIKLYRNYLRFCSVVD